MFTGIIECTAKVLSIIHEKSNITFTLEAPIGHELRIDQSLSHNGVCLTVISVKGNQYEVTAVEETLSRTNLASLKTGDRVNLERCLQMNGRLDGHIVQGHVDTTGICSGLEEKGGSWLFRFEYRSQHKSHCTVEKGSICVNGVSLTVVDSGDNSFSVAIIPYTYEHTNFKTLKKGDKVNLEFDIVGKYVAKLMSSPG